jgi:hypothetical protein
MCPNRLYPGLIGWGAGPAEVLGDRAQGHELPGGPRSHLWAIVGDCEQDRPGRVVHRRVDGPVLVGGDGSEQTFGIQCVGEAELHLGGGLLHADDLGNPLSGDQVLDSEHCHTRGGEVRGVVDPDRVGGVVDPVREGLTHRAAGPRTRPEILVCQEQHSPHAGRRDPDPTQVGAAVGQLAVTALDLTPLVEQRHDLGRLLGQQAVHRRPARWPVG